MGHLRASIRFLTPMNYAAGEILEAQNEAKCCTKTLIPVVGLRVPATIDERLSSLSIHPDFWKWGVRFLTLSAMWLRIVLIGPFPRYIAAAKCTISDDS